MSYGKIDPWKAGAVFAVIIMPVAAMAYNAMHAFPVSKTTIILFAAITILCAVLIELKTSEKDSFLRQTGIIILFALAIVSVGGLALHGALGRDLSLASEAETAYAKAKKDYESRFDQLHNQELEDKSQDAEAARIELEREKIRLAQNVERRRRNLPPLPEPRQKRNETTETSLQRLAPPEQPETQTDVIKRFAPYNFWAQFIDMLLSVAGLAFIMAVRQWDANSDGCPDWIEREARTIPEKEFARRHPDWYERFYPKGTTLAAREDSTVNAESSRRIGFNPSPSLPKIESRKTESEESPKSSPQKVSTPGLQKVLQNPRKSVPHAELSYKESRRPGVETFLETQSGELFGDQKWSRHFGVKVPIIPGTRWKKNKGKGIDCVINPPPKDGSKTYLGFINKNILLESKNLPDLEKITFFNQLIDQWKQDRETKTPLTPEEN